MLSNTATRSLALTLLPTGTHHLTVRALDPGVMLDHIEIDLDGATKHYAAPID